MNLTDQDQAMLKFSFFMAREDGKEACNLLFLYLRKNNRLPNVSKIFPDWSDVRVNTEDYQYIFQLEDDLEFLHESLSSLLTKTFVSPNKPMDNAAADEVVRLLKIYSKLSITDGWKSTEETCRSIAAGISAQCHVMEDISFRSSDLAKDAPVSYLKIKEDVTAEQIFERRKVYVHSASQKVKC